ncbi:MAG: hypothetical protein HC828_06420 [Blastochloris sp.]|nr:hypothetical protein [Blastochloris sp.]
MDTMQQLEAAVEELIDIYQISAPPIPIESMLQHPKADMWEEVDLSQLSLSFVIVNEQYSPRMSLARMLARHVIHSSWGHARGLDVVDKDEAALHAFARMLIMPASMVRQLTSASRTAALVGMHFEVPETDAKQRLEELLF